MNKKKQIEERLPIEDRPTEELKKRAEIPVDFSALISKAVKFKQRRKRH
jgi:hypothetical protein